MSFAPTTVADKIIFKLGSQSFPILYISYDGALEPLGRSQVLTYLMVLTNEVSFSLLTFEKEFDFKCRGRINYVDMELRAAGIDWYPRQYHKKPTLIATAWDVLIGVYSGIDIIRRNKIKVVHARSYVAGVIALLLKRLMGVKFVFDIRGFWADERVEAGLWPRHGFLFWLAKRVEALLFRNADHIISLTHMGVVEIRKSPVFRERTTPPLSVITTCTDLNRFKPLGAKDQGFTLGYVGSASLWYDFDSAVIVFKQLLLQSVDARVLIVNRHDHDLIRSKLQLHEVPLGRVELVSADPSDIPVYMNRMHAGVFFITPSYSKRASAPTKLGEFLGCGVPCLTNTGIGDMSSLLKENNVGVVVPDFSRDSLLRGLDRIITLCSETGVTDRCRVVAERHLSLDYGVKRYREIYSSLM